MPEGHVTSLLHYRPNHETVDAVIQLLYVVFACAACYDSTWGAILCAEWGVRRPPVRMPAPALRH